MRTQLGYAEMTSKMGAVTWSSPAIIPTPTMRMIYLYNHYSEHCAVFTAQRVNNECIAFF